MKQEILPLSLLCIAFAFRLVNWVKSELVLFYD